MVNKPQALYREDARLAFEKDRHLLTSAHGRSEVLERLRTQYSTNENITFGTTYNELLQQSLRYLDSLHLQREPRVMTANLDTGFGFRCLISSTERGSYISESLFQQIRPRPRLFPIADTAFGARLRFNGSFLRAIGTITFAMKMNAPGEEKVIEVMVTANVVPGLSPDLFLGNEQRVDGLLPYAR